MRWSAIQKLGTEFMNTSFVLLYMMYYWYKNAEKLFSEKKGLIKIKSSSASVVWHGVVITKMSWQAQIMKGQ